MEVLMKILTGVLGVLAVIACLATIGAVGYSLGRGESDRTQEVSKEQEAEATPVPTAVPEPSPEEERQPEALDHVHKYEETIDRKAACYQTGRRKFTCECGDFYYEDIPSTGHVPDEWEVSKEATSSQEGQRVRKCIYCDETVAMEAIPKNAQSKDHTHQYTASVEREASCVLAGLRKYTCSECGSFYTEKIQAMGHVATDWTEVEKPTTTVLGREQLTCVVCGVVLDSRPIPVLEPSPSPTQSPTPTPSAAPTATPAPGSTPAPTKAPTPTPAPTASPTPTPTPHVHQYTSYILKEPNCQDKGERSFVCSCGSTYGEVIDPDPNRHTYTSTLVPATPDSQGYTIYRCIRCNYSYNDNYTPATN